MNREIITAVIVCHGHTAICPACGGMMHTITPGYYKCMDCNSKYAYMDAGIADKEITVKKVG